jgi:exosortase A-associated hydrolase 2
MAAELFFASTDPRFDDPFAESADLLAARLCLFHPPAGPAGTPPRAAVLHVHAFGEEMNKSRRMAALQARALAGAGCAVLQFDLLGCGDSAGDHGDATWSRWQADLRWAAALLRRRADAAVPLVLWGQRTGALLAAQALADLAGDISGDASASPGTPPALLLWQPVHQGRQALQQFLRLAVATQLLDGGGKGVVEGLKRGLAEGRAVHVAGYRLHPELATGLEAATLAPPAGLPPGRAAWLEVAGPAADGAVPAPSPATAMAAERWRGAGWAVQTTAVAGPAFWQTTAIEDAPALLPATLRALEALIAAAPEPLSEAPAA